MDAITVHPYMATPEDSINGNECWGGLRYIMRQHGPELPVISGEWGWNTCVKPCDGDWGNYGLSEGIQAEYVARQWLVNWLHQVPSVWYEWHTNVNNPHSFEGNFGSVRYTYYNDSYPYAPKPGYHAAVTVQNLFGSMDEVQGIDGGADNYILRATGPNGSVAYAVWSVNKLTSDLRVPMSPPGCYTQYDLAGGIQDEKCTTHDEELILIHRSFRPTYLILNHTSSVFTSLLV